MLERSVSHADAIALVHVIGSHNVVTPVPGGPVDQLAWIVRPREVLSGSVPQDSFLVHLRPTFDGGGHPPSSRRLVLVFLVRGGQRWALNDGINEFANGTRTLAEEDVRPLRDRIRNVLRRQELESLALRSDAVVVAHLVEGWRNCELAAGQRRCRGVVVERSIAGGVACDTLAIYSETEFDAFPQKAVLFLRERGAGVYQTVSYFAGTVAIRDDGATKFGPVDSLLARINSIRSNGARRRP